MCLATCIITIQALGSNKKNENINNRLHFNFLACASQVMASSEHEDLVLLYGHSDAMLLALLAQNLASIFGV